MFFKTNGSKKNPFAEMNRRSHR